MQGQILAGTDYTGGDNLLEIELPSLDSFIESAIRVSPARKYFEDKSMVEQLEIRRLRLDWLGLFSIDGSYRYGMSQALLSQNTVTDIFSSFSTQAQNWYAVGVSVRIPLNVVTDTRIKVKQQRLRVQMERSQAEMENTTLRDKVITLYNDVLLQMTLLRSKGELYKVGFTQMKMSEASFVRGEIKIVEYTRQMDVFTKMQVDYEMCRGTLRSSLTKLEYLTDIKVLK